MLSKLLEDKAAASKVRLSEEARRTYAEGIETVRSTDIERSARQVGDAAIDARLSGIPPTSPVPLLVNRSESHAARVESSRTLRFVEQK